MGSQASDGTPIGQAFVDAIAHLDFERVEGLLAPEVRFRALIPKSVKTGSTAQEAVTEIRRWFEDTEQVNVLSSRVDAIVDRVLVGYHMRELEGGTWYELEQTGVAIVADARIVDLSMLCSGFRAIEVQPDAIDLRPAPTRLRAAPALTAAAADARLIAIGESCATLTPAIRREIGALASGQTLEVVTDDPSAGDALRSWTRLTGHALLDVRPAEGNATSYLLRHA